MVTRKVWDNVQPAEAFGGAESVDLNTSRWEKPLQCALDPAPQLAATTALPSIPPFGPAGSWAYLRARPFTGALRLVSRVDGPGLGKRKMPSGDLPLCI